MSRFSTGWVKLHRKMFEGDIAGNKNLFCIWSWLLLAANYRESRVLFCGEQRAVMPGSLICGIAEIAEKLDLSRSTVHKWLHYLASSERIDLEVRTHGCFVTIRNWEQYQGRDDDERTIISDTSNASRTPAERGPTLNEEVQEGKNTNNGVLELSPLVVKEDFDLEALYQSYPKRPKGLDMKKSAGMKKFRKIIKTIEKFTLVQTAVLNYAAYVKAENKEKFVKQWNTFAGEWEEWVKAEPAQIQTFDFGDKYA